MFLQCFWTTQAKNNVKTLFFGCLSKNSVNVTLFSSSQAKNIVTLARFVLGLKKTMFLQCVWTTQAKNHVKTWFFLSPSTKSANVTMFLAWAGENIVTLSLFVLGLKQNNVFTMFLDNPSQKQCKHIVC